MSFSSDKLPMFVVVVVVVCTFAKRLNSEVTTEDKKFFPILQKLAALSREEIKRDFATDSTCSSLECLIRSRKLKDKMETQAEPCEDFYDYACGSWTKQAVPEDHAVVDIFTSMAEKIENRMKELLENQQWNKENKPAQLAYNWYAACLDIEQRNLLGTRPMMQLLRDAMKTDGEFAPFLPRDWEGENLDLEQTLARINHNYTVMPFFEIALASDASNASSPTRITISVPKLTLQEESVYFLRTSYSIRLVLAYLRLMVELGELLGAEDLRQLLLDIEEIVLLEAWLAEEIAASDEGDKTEEDLAMTIAQLQQLTDQHVYDKESAFDWLKFFRELFDGVPGQSPITEEEVIFVEHPTYVWRAVYLLSRIKNRVLANYMAWTLIHKYAPYLSSEFHVTYLKFAETVYGVKRDTPLWRRCVRSTMKSMDMSAAYLYVNDSMTEETINTTKEMVDHLKTAFIENLDLVDWMDDRTREAAKEKAEAMIDQVGYPDFITNVTLLELYFEGIIVDENTFFQNKLSEDRTRKLNTWRQKGEVPYRYSWDMRPTEPNAYYSPNTNKIVVSAAIMQNPFFDKSYPEALNYGALGFVVGHEMTHGFDDHGAQYDKEGNLRNWWSERSLRKFRQHTQCMKRQYSKYKVFNFHIDGEQTLGENIADNGGLKFAYRAYQKWLQEHGADRSLPNVALSEKQLFFLSFAQVWCERATDGFAMHQLRSDEHSPSKFRVLGTLQNSEVFSEAFNCPLGSKMNPKEKCTVW